MSNILRILGTAAGPGIPSFYCHCAACEEARQNPKLARTRTGLCLHLDGKNILIDASPDLRQQLLRENIDEVHGIYLTHWHPDHYEGLREMEYYVQLQLHLSRKIPLCMPKSAVKVYEQTYNEFVDTIYDITPWEMGDTFKEGNLTLTMLPAVHSIETAGILIEGGKNSFAYFPDTTNNLSDNTINRLHGVDYFICDASCHGENWFSKAHMNVDEAINLGKKIGAKHTVLTHIAHHYSVPITYAGLKQEIFEEKQEKNVIISCDGMTFEL